ncbi:MAG: hypothetical protein JWN25_2642 [Verrucomicrobiales bacterium]|nr:hypothetical protein [Verrucomicrobiales bacterium]
MKVLILLLAVFTLAACSSTGRLVDTSKLQPSRGAILEGNAALKLFSQCSRSAPKPDGFWTPATEVISIMETEFPDQMNRIHSFHRAPFEKYYRQYAGFTKSTRRYIYCNFFTGSQDDELFRTRAIIACDGGDEFFGVVYDVENHKFQDYRANGGLY